MLLVLRVLLKLDDFHSLWLGSHMAVHCDLPKYSSEDSRGGGGAEVMMIKVSIKHVYMLERSSELKAVNNFCGFCPY